MAYCVSDTLDQFYDVSRIDIRIERAGDYWAIWEVHRHETGQMARCQPTPYDHLTTEEALDVVCAIAATLLPSRLPLEPRSM